MNQATSELFHQGRVMSTGMDKISLLEQTPIPTPTPPVFEVVKRAMELAVRSIDLVWLTRQENLSDEARKNLCGWLQKRKNAAADLRLSFVELNLPEEMHGKSVRINNSGKVFVLREGQYMEWRIISLL